jgi:UDP-N-acetylmuramyl pentapeptide synthase
VDGDEEQQSAAVAVCDGATGDGAEQSGDAAPSTSEAGPADVDAEAAAAEATDLVEPGDCVLVKASRAVGLEHVADALAAVSA